MNESIKHFSARKYFVLILIIKNLILFVMEEERGAWQPGPTRATEETQNQNDFFRGLVESTVRRFGAPDRKEMNKQKSAETAMSIATRNEMNSLKVLPNFGDDGRKTLVNGAALSPALRRNGGEAAGGATATKTACACVCAR